MSASTRWIDTTLASCSRVHCDANNHRNRRSLTYGHSRQMMRFGPNDKWNRSRWRRKDTLHTITLWYYHRPWYRFLDIPNHRQQRSKLNMGSINKTWGRNMPRFLKNLWSAGVECDTRPFIIRVESYGRGKEIAHQEIFSNIHRLKCSFPRKC